MSSARCFHELSDLLYSLREVSVQQLQEKKKTGFEIPWPTIFETFNVTHSKREISPFIGCAVKRMSTDNSCFQRFYSF